MVTDGHALFCAAIIGVGGTIALDLWAVLVHRVSGSPGTNWAMVGRWLAHMRAGQFLHESIAKASPVRGELALGWFFHFAVGIVYGVLLIEWQGISWLEHPTVIPPVVLSLIFLVAPYFAMMPGLGLGVAGAKTPKPYITRLKSVFAHSAFGLGMYATALLLNLF